MRYIYKHVSCHYIMGVVVYMNYTLTAYKKSQEGYNRGGSMNFLRRAGTSRSLPLFLSRLPSP